MATTSVSRSDSRLARHGCAGLVRKPRESSGLGDRRLSRESSYTRGNEKQRESDEVALGAVPQEGSDPQLPKRLAAKPASLPAPVLVQTGDEDETTRTVLGQHGDAAVNALEPGCLTRLHRMTWKVAPAVVELVSGTWRGLGPARLAANHLAGLPGCAKHR
jgi:hypothetical protein